MTDSKEELLHALGNHLNAALLLAEDLAEQVDQSKLEQFGKANALLGDNRHRLQEFFNETPRGSLLVEYYFEIEVALKCEREGWQAELKRLTKELGAMRNLMLAKK